MRYSTRELVRLALFWLWLGAFLMYVLLHLLMAVGIHV